MKLGTIAFRNMKRNIRRTALSVTATAIAAMCFVFLFSILVGLKQDMRYNLQSYYSGEVRIRNPEFDRYEQLNPLFFDIPDAMVRVDAIQSAFPEVLISPRITFPAAIYTEEENIPSMGVAVDMEREQAFQSLEELVVAGRVPRMGENELLLTPGLLEDAGLEVGDTVTMFAQTRGRGSNGFSMEVVGVVKYPVSALNKSYFVAPLDRLQYFLRMGDGVTEVLVKTGDNRSLELERALNAMIERDDWGEVHATSWLNIDSTYSMLAMADISYTIMAMIFFLLGATVIINTTMMVIFERTREIGTIAAMGMTGRQILLLFFLEALFIVIIGSLVGVAVGSGITYQVGKVGIDFGVAMDDIDWEFSPVFYPVLTWATVIRVFIFSTLVAGLAALFSTRRAAKINPIEALRG